MESKLRRVKESTIQKWKKSRSNDNNNQLQKPEINENESIKIDENCIQIISRAPSQVVIEKSEGNEIKRVNGKRKMIKALNDKTEEKDSSEFQLENGCLKVNENLQPDRLHVESNAASDIESIFEADSESLHSKKAENRQQNNLKSSSFGGCEEICTPSEDHLADTAQNTYNLDSNDDETSHHDNSTNVPHKKSSNLLDFNYIIDRVGSRVIRVYKDSDSSHFYCNAPK
uniref:Uncharacterized protein n=1 Tax=Panagrolaimus superbus TaxID=310955 RepID=A0A914Z4A6_9BILA